MHITDNFIILWTESLKSCQSLGLCGLFISSLKVKSLSHVRLFVTPWTVAYEAPPSMGFSRQEDWSGVPLPSPYLKLYYIKIKLPKTSLLVHWLRILLVMRGTLIRSRVPEDPTCLRATKPMGHIS